jgi:hypothetical protein
VGKRTRACLLCGPRNPYAELYGQVAGSIPVPDGDLVTWKPCPSCRPEQHAAWWGGYLRDVERRRAEQVKAGGAG